jgi:hypothetical protein
MLDSLFGGLGLFGSGIHSQQQAALAQQQADQQLALAMAQAQGGCVLVPPGTAKNMRNIHTIRGRAYRCDYCDRLTVKPDYENGCRGCGAHDFK